VNLLAEKVTTAICLDNILFATDFSAASEAVLPYVRAISRRYDSTIHAVHVTSEFKFVVPSEAIDPTTLESFYEGQERDAGQKMQRVDSSLEGTNHQTIVRKGDLWEIISGIIRQQKIDLLALGTHGRTGVEKMLLGSAAETLLRRALCPVLTVGPRVSIEKSPALLEPENHDGEREIQFRRILYATDFSRASLVALPFAISLAQEFQARLVLLHVMDQRTDDLMKHWGPAEGALQHLQHLVPEEAALWFSPEPLVHFGSPAESILQIATENNSDLIVLGVRPEAGHLGAATHLPWTTAHQVLARAACPVLTVRG
jgi:nucleotide-binding universal stress UspA family protein